ncbi:MAG TPA: dNTP triphosphohydrolase, partial [Saliniramus sp.]|nr:dNTP triphosphohydrolase [Saliniramus sp.]
GGFDHNAQALRIVTRLECRYAAYDGLNLTWETLEGLVKHNGPLLDAVNEPTERYRAHGVPGAILEFDARFPLDLATHASAEAQAAALADDIAYNSHDIDDGLRAGLFRLDDLRAIPFLAELLDEIAARWPGLETPRRIHELTRRVITSMVEDVIAESSRRIAALSPKSAAEIRNASHPVIAFSEKLVEADRAIKGYLYPNMYRHAKVKVVREHADLVVRDLFQRFMSDPSALPGDWSAGIEELDAMRHARRISDYIAGMTDGYAIQEHRRLFGSTPELRIG